MLHRITAAVQVAKLLIAASVKLPRAGQVVEDTMPVNRVPDQVRCVCFFFIYFFPRLSFSPPVGKHLPTDFKRACAGVEYMHGQWTNQIA